MTRLSSALVLVTPLPKRRDAKELVGASELGTGELDRACGGLDRHRGIAVAGALSGPLDTDVALPPKELGDLCLEGGLHDQAGSDPADLLEDLGEVALRRKKLVNLGADALGGGYSFHGRSLLSLASRLLIGAYVRRLRRPGFYTGVGSLPSYLHIRPRLHAPPSA